jgi:hypothetical protein
LAKSELTRHDTVGALARARVGHLEGLGLVTLTKDGTWFASDLKARLDMLQKSQDVMRKHWAEKRADVDVSKQRENIVPLDRVAEAQQGRPRLKQADLNTDQLLPQDVELARLGQARGGDGARSSLARPELETRAVYLVSKGYGVPQGECIGFKPAAWAKLRDANIARALERQLGISGRNISHGLSEGVVIGSINTSLGKQTVIDRGVGIAVAPVSSRQQLSIGHVIGAGLER